MSKILITGASGFVGSWLVKEALKGGLEVYAGIRATSSTSLIEDERINHCILDLDDEAAISEQMRAHQFDFIIHVAGVTRAQNDSTYFKVNSDYTSRLARVATEILGDKLKKFVFISSIEAFGSADGTPNDVVDNEVDPSPRTTYGLSKLRAEQELAKVVGLPLIILRPTAVFGPAERDLFAFWKTVKRFKVTPSVGDPDIKYSFVYVKDLVRVTMAATLSDIKGKAYFVSDGRIHKMKDFLGHIANSLDTRTLTFTIPYILLDSVVLVTSFVDKITGKKSLLNQEQIAKAKARNWDCDISDLVNDFDYRPRYTLEAAVNETTDWYITNNWL